MLKVFLFLIQLLFAISAKKKKKEPRYYHSEEDGNEVDVESPDMDYEDINQPYYAKPTLTATKPMMPTTGSTNKNPSKDEGVATTISNKTVTIYPTIQSPRLKGEGNTSFHGLILPLALAFFAMALAVFA